MFLVPITSVWLYTFITSAICCESPSAICCKCRVPSLILVSGNSKKRKEKLKSKHEIRHKVIHKRRNTYSQKTIKNVQLHQKSGLNQSSKTLFSPTFKVTSILDDNTQMMGISRKC